MAKGQSSLELLVTVGVVIAFTIPVLFLLLSVSSVGYEDTAKAQADATARTLADTMNTVYAQGPDAQREVLLNVPASTESLYASEGEVVVRIRTSSGPFEASSPTIAKIGAGSRIIEHKTGLFKLVIHSYRGTDGKVEVEILDPASP